MQETYILERRSVNKAGAQKNTKYILEKAKRYHSSATKTANSNPDLSSNDNNSGHHFPFIMASDFSRYDGDNNPNNPLRGVPTNIG